MALSLSLLSIFLLISVGSIITIVQATVAHDALVSEVEKKEESASKQALFQPHWFVSSSSSPSSSVEEQRHSHLLGADANGSNFAASSPSRFFTTELPSTVLNCNQSLANNTNDTNSSSPAQNWWSFQYRFALQCFFVFAIFFVTMLMCFYPDEPMFDLAYSKYGEMRSTANPNPMLAAAAAVVQKGTQTSMMNSNATGGGGAGGNDGRGGGDGVILEKSAVGCPLPKSTSTRI